MKITKEIQEKIQKGLKEKKGYTEIARELGISVTSVIYHSNIENRKRRIKQSVEYFRNLSKKEKAAVYLRRKEYVNNYLNEKYKNDESFREKKKKYSREHYNKIRVKKDGNN